MKVFVSIPMSWGTSTRTIKDCMKSAADRYSKQIGQRVELIDSVIENGRSPLYCLGISLVLMSEADAVIFTDYVSSDLVIDWNTARGCRLEYEAATLYGKKIVIDDRFGG